MCYKSEINTQLNKFRSEKAEKRKATGIKIEEYVERQKKMLQLGHKLNSVQKLKRIEKIKKGGKSYYHKTKMTNREEDD